MKIALVTPAKPGSRNGNRNTALRWASMLRRLGHRVRVQTEWGQAPADAMLALHARRSHASIERFAARYPARQLVLALTGTDLYGDIRFDPAAQASLRLASDLVVLQSEGLRELAAEHRAKARVVYQSAPSIRRRPPLRTVFEVLVVGHLREVKDPFRAALALRQVPPDSRIRVRQFGSALDAEHARQARKLEREQPRYRWLGERAHWQVRKSLARAALMVISSRTEGGANVIAEAIAAGCPIIASRMSGNIGMLGHDYAGYYPVGDERALARLLRRAEIDPPFYRRLKQQCAARRALFSPSAERAALARLFPPPRSGR